MILLLQVAVIVQMMPGPLVVAAMPQVEHQPVVEPLLQLHQLIRVEMVMVMEIKVTHYLRNQCNKKVSSKVYGIVGLVTG